MRAFGVVLSVAVAGCGGWPPAPAAEIAPAEPTASAATTASAARGVWKPPEALTRDERQALREARVARLQEKLERDLRAASGSAYVEAQKSDEEITLLLTNNAEGGLRRDGWVVNDRSETPFPTGLRGGLYRLHRGPMRSLVALYQGDYARAAIRVGPEGNLSVAMVPPTCSQPGVAETVCGGEILCGHQNGVLGEEEETLQPSACSKRRDALRLELPRRALALREQVLAKVTQLHPPAGDSCEIQGPEIESVEARLKPFMLKKIPLLMREVGSKVGPNLSDRWVEPREGCTDGKGNYVIRVIASLPGSDGVVLVWRLKGKEAFSMILSSIPGGTQEIGDLDGDGVAELAMSHGNTAGREVCRLYSLTMKSRDLPVEICNNPSTPVTLPGEVALVQGEIIWGLRRGSLVPLKGPGAHESLQQELDLLAARRAAAQSFVNSLNQAPAGWGPREAACQNPLRAAWAREAKESLLAAGFPDKESTQSALLLTGLDACLTPPPGLP